MNHLFVDTYAEARERFSEEAEKAGFRLMRTRIPAEDSPELFQDYAILRRDPEKLLIHISGVHGIEGYMGSAIQRSLLETPLGEKGPSLLFLHAFNPYGMAFYRRANSENVDLNRNFRAGPAKPNPDYRLFDGYLNPRSRLGFYTGLVSGYLNFRRIGKARSAMAIAAGQADFPRGIFYMGARVQREIYLCQEFLRSHAKEAREVVILDAHSGLGAFKAELLFVDKDAVPEDPRYFSEIFGRPVTTTDPANGIYKNQGPLSDGLREALPRAKVHYALQEFGALPDTVTLNALREENFQWHRREPGTERPAAVKEKMLAAFCPADPGWRQNALHLGALRWRQSLERLERS